MFSLKIRNPKKHELLCHRKSVFMDMSQKFILIELPYGSEGYFLVVFWFNSEKK